MPATRDDILELVRRQKYAVQASVTPGGAPQAAVVGIVVSERFEVFFDTLDSSRKFTNLAANARIAFVIGWDEERTVQLEGVADVPTGAELERLCELYFARFPDGRERRAGWPGLTYVRTRATWLRYSDFRAASSEIVELDEAALTPR